MEKFTVRLVDTSAVIRAQAETIEHIGESDKSFFYLFTFLAKLLSGEDINFPKARDVLNAHEKGRHVDDIAFNKAVGRLREIDGVEVIELAQVA